MRWGLLRGDLSCCSPLLFRSLASCPRVPASLAAAEASHHEVRVLDTSLEGEVSAGHSLSHCLIVSLSRCAIASLPCVSLHHDSPAPLLYRVLLRQGVTTSMCHFIASLVPLCHSVTVLPPCLRRPVTQERLNQVCKDLKLQRLLAVVAAP